MKFHLIGPYEGKTCTLNGVKFVDGVAEVPDADTEKYASVLRYYQAYKETELDQKKKEFKAAQDALKPKRQTAKKQTAAKGDDDGTASTDTDKQAS